MRINNNIMAMNTHRQYGINNMGAARSVEKLSSGYRINRAGDDAAGLAISEKMRAQIRGLTMASKNSQDAISLVQTAEGALQETHNILQRMREISVQSASDTNETSIDRDALNKEFQALIAEIDDTAEKTKFNDMGLIDGKFAKVISGTTADTLPAGITAVDLSGLVGNYADGDTLNINIQTVAGAGTPAQAPTVNQINISDNTSTHNISAINITLGDWAKGTTLNGKTIDSFSFNVNGDTSTFSLNIDGDTFTSGNLTLASTQDLSSALTLTDTGGSNTITVTLVGGGSDFNTAKATGFNADSGSLSGTVNSDGADAVGAPGTIKIDGVDVTANINANNSLTLANGVILTGLDTSAFADATETLSYTLDIEENYFVVQTGANKGDELNINIDKMDANALFGAVAQSKHLAADGTPITPPATLADVKVSDRASAGKSIEWVNNAINKVSTQRAALGALQNRLEHKIANLDTSAENLQSAESRIRDLDMAQEMTSFTKSNILSQASTAMLAQANSLPQGVLSLLR